MRGIIPSRILLSLAAVALVKAQLNLGQPTTPIVPISGQTTNPVTTPVPAPATGFPLSTPATPVPVPVPGASAAPGSSPPEENGWPGCVDPDRPDELVKVGRKTTICIVLGSSTEWNVLTPATKYLRLSFQPKADEYSRFHVPSSYQDLVLNPATTVHDGSNNVTIHVSSQKAVSFQRIFFTPNAGAGKVYPHLTAIIDVQKGVVKGITWDDACLFCGKSRCEENTYDFNGRMGTQKDFGQPTKGCYIEQATCTAASTQGGDNEQPCDVLVYVVWTGDDEDGKALQSSAFRFSAFPEQELKNRLLDGLPDIPDVPDLPDFGLGGGEA